MSLDQRQHRTEVPPEPHRHRRHQRGQPFSVKGIATRRSPSPATAGAHEVLLAVLSRPATRRRPARAPVRRAREISRVSFSWWSRRAVVVVIRPVGPSRSIIRLGFAFTFWTVGVAQATLGEQAAHDVAELLRLQPASLVDDEDAVFDLAHVVQISALGGGGHLVVGRGGGNARCIASPRTCRWEDWPLTTMDASRSSRRRSRDQIDDLHRVGLAGHLGLLGVRRRRDARLAGQRRTLSRRLAALGRLDRPARATARRP